MNISDIFKQVELSVDFIKAVSLTIYVIIIATLVILFLIALYLLTKKEGANMQPVPSHENCRKSMRKSHYGTRPYTVAETCNSVSKRRRYTDTTDFYSGSFNSTHDSSFNSTHDSSFNSTHDSSCDSSQDSCD